MQEENISGNESLLIIESMINKAKNQFSENGDLYLLWGWWVFVCSIAEFVMLHFFKSEWHWLVWWTFPLIIAAQFVYLRKKRKNVRVRTYTDEIIGFVWLTFLILMALVVFVLSRTSEANQTALFYPAFLILYGMPTFLSGVILKFRVLVFGGVGCWVLAVLSTFISPGYHLLLLPVAMLIAWIIPGYMLRRKYKLQTV